MYGLHFKKFKEDRESDDKSVTSAPVKITAKVSNNENILSVSAKTVPGTMPSALAKMTTGVVPLASVKIMTVVLLALVKMTAEASAKKSSLLLVLVKTKTEAT